MKQTNFSERLLLEEIAEIAKQSKKISKNLTIGSLIRMIRTQLGMSQIVLANRARVPQSTISRIEKGDKGANLSTLNKVLGALSCDLIMVPKLRESIDEIRSKQAKKQAEKHMAYLKGTMSLEEQQPDSRFLEGLLKQEENRLLQGPGTELWKK